MQCLKCGAVIEDGFRVCRKCGYPVKNESNNSDIKIESVVSENIVNSNIEVQSTSSNIDKIVPDSSNSITNSNFEIFDSLNNEYDDVDIMKDEQDTQNKDISYDDDYSSNIFFKYKYFIVTGGAVFIIIIALLFSKYLPNDVDDRVKENNNITTYNKIIFKNYMFSIPDKYGYSVNNESITIGDFDGNFGIQLEVSNGDYNKLVLNKGELSKILEKKNYTCGEASIIEENNIDFLVLEVNINGEKSLLAFSKVDSSKYFVISLFNKDNEIDYDLMKIASNIIDLVEEVKPTNKLNSKNLFKNEFDVIAK